MDKITRRFTVLVAFLWLGLACPGGAGEPLPTWNWPLSAGEWDALHAGKPSAWSVRWAWPDQFSADHWSLKDRTEKDYFPATFNPAGNCWRTAAPADSDNNAVFRERLQGWYKDYDSIVSWQAPGDGVVSLDFGAFPSTFAYIKGTVSGELSLQRNLGDLLARKTLSDIRPAGTPDAPSAPDWVPVYKGDIPVMKGELLHFRLHVAESNRPVDAALKIAIAFKPGLTSDPLKGSVMRREMPLNTHWFFLDSPAASPPQLPLTGWQTVDVPHQGSPKRYAWYRHNLNLPEDFKGKQVSLIFHGIVFSPVAYLNGKEIAANPATLKPWVIDLTDKFTPGTDNDLLVRVEPHGPSPFTTPNSFDHGTGIYFEIDAQALPRVRTGDLLITPSFRKHRLEVSGKIENTGTTEFNGVMNASVIDAAGKQVLDLGQQKATLAGGATQAFTLSKPWPDPHLWFPHDPYLYRLKLTLTNGSGTVDDNLQTFGFREFWIDGLKVLCNGVNAPLRRNSETYMYHRSDRQTLVRLMTEFQGDGFNLFRWHAAPCPDYLLDEADRAGLLITEEMDMWLYDRSKWQDPTFQARFLEHSRAVARYSRNHPCLFSYSLANESVWSTYWTQPGSELATFFRNVHAAVRAVDPRTFISEACGDDLWSLSEFRDWHYPNNISARWYSPNSDYWVVKHPYPGSTEEQSGRNRPVILGEDYWPGYNAYGSYAAVFGDDFYCLGGPTWERYYLADLMRRKTDAYRLTPGLAVINPAYPAIKDWCRNVAPPVGLLLQDYRNAFWSGDTVTLAFGLANEVWFPQRLKVVWSLNDAASGKTVMRDERSYDMAAGTIRPVTLSFRAPATTERTRYQFKASVRTPDGRENDPHTIEIAVFPKRPLTLPHDAGTALFDPRAKLTKLMPQARRIDQVTAGTLAGVRLLVIAPEALAPHRTMDDPARGATEPPPKVNYQELQRFLTAGGRCLVLDQGAGAILPLDVPVRGTDTRATVSFLRRPEHPAVKGLADSDFRWWGPDHWVAYSLYAKTARAFQGQGNFRVITEAGDPCGLRFTPLFEQFYGTGVILFCQYPVVEKAAACPPAARLLQNCFDYLATVHPRHAQTGLLGNGPLTDWAAQAGLDHVTAPTLDALRNCPLIVIQADALKQKNNAVDAAAYVKNGGCLVVKDITPENAAPLGALAGRPITVKPIAPYAAFRFGMPATLSGVSQYDLVWRQGNWFPDDATKPIAPACRHVVTGLPAAQVLAFATDHWQALDDPTRRQLAENAAVVAEIPVGKGRIVLDNVLWHEPAGLDVGFIYAATLLRNLGASFTPAPPTAAAAATGRMEPISLEPIVNHPLDADLSGGPEAHFQHGLNSLVTLPRGERVTLDNGVPYTISGLVVLKSLHASGMPLRTQPLPVGRKFTGLHVLLGYAWDGQPGTVFCTFKINYQGGKSVAVDALCEVNAQGWWEAPKLLKGATLAWEGRNEAHSPICLYDMPWQNPQPDRMVESIEIISGNSDAIPIIAGLTLTR